METAVKAHRAQMLAAQFDLHTRLFNNVLDGITDAEAQERARDTVNPVKWLAGHLTSTRFGMGKIAGLQEQDPWGELFSHGHGIRDDVDYPSLDEIKAKWKAISDTISASLAHHESPSVYSLANKPKTTLSTKRSLSMSVSRVFGRCVQDPASPWLSSHSRGI